MVDLTELCLIEGKVVYTVFVDVNILNVDGNLFDATSYAVVSALRTAQMQKYEPDGDKVKATGEMGPVPISKIPVSITIARIGTKLVVDPSIDEEAVMDARITLTTDDGGNVCAGQKGNPGTLTPAQVMEAAEISIRRGKEIRKQIAKATN
jgi:exosome complex component RRP42